MDEHADAAEQIIRFRFRDDAFGNAVGDRLGDLERGQRELGEMFEARDAELNAVSIGGAVMIDYLVNGNKTKTKYTSPHF
jgi:hypothetical protein